MGSLFELDVVVAVADDSHPSEMYSSHKLVSDTVNYIYSEIYIMTLKLSWRSTHASSLLMI